MTRSKVSHAQDVNWEKRLGFGRRQIQAQGEPSQLDLFAPEPRSRTVILRRTLAIERRPCDAMPCDAMPCNARRTTVTEDISLRSRPHPRWIRQATHIHASRMNPGAAYPQPG